ncbi:RluA family pseudouridine synthase [Novosphingobium sp. FSY-8]|uniref:Ribosomal large subunit pseudouridine synthase D n=1 Tax=Novosphingobium ovatum TaxID=1908523 RepID=A0ABW9XE09_9SPHN|nr:RluA family pseudouridine synthase [Novosphingobium ovatum]NBC36779.1 RluA family pseudouridine synthase [Novosphingobium ovatum]
MTEKTEHNVRQFIVGGDDDGIRLDRWFKRHLPQVGFATISRWARTGQIRVDGKRAAPEDRITKGQTLRVPPGDSHVRGAAAGKSARQRKPLTEEQLEMADAMVIHRDPAAIVINKPPGLATQGGSGTHEHVDGLLDAYATHGPRPRLVHRLDKDTSGVLLVAATPGSAAFFSKRFSTRGARKIYWALVAGVPSIEEGLIDLPLAKQPGTGGEKMMVDQSEQGQPSRSRYRVLDRAGNRACWVELQPLTGRTHQLRVHMAAIGHPIIGDGKYGGQDAFLSGSISRKMHLHARRLIIDHPDGTMLDVEAALPDHFAASLAQLGFDENDGEYIPDPSGELTREEIKAAARAHAKDYRKERKGERRGRAETGRTRNDSRIPPAKKGGVKKGLGSPKPTKPTGGKPAGGRPAGGKPTGGKPAGGAPRPAGGRGVGRPSTPRGRG